MTSRAWCAAVVLVLTAAAACSASTTETASSTESASGASAAVATTAPAPDLQAVADSFVATQSVDFSIVAVDFASGARADHLADRVVLSASLYKLFVAAELLRRIDAGSLARTAPIGDSKGRTVDECITAMIVVSDNACGAAGLALVGYGRLDSTLHAAGYVSTTLHEPQQTSAADVALFLTRARSGELLGPGHEASTRALYGLLAAQQVNDRLPTGLPPGTPIAHKTGDRRQWAHDAGIVTTPRGDLLVVVLSGPWPAPCCDADHPGAAEQKAFGAIAALGAAFYTASA